ncbi:spore coat putative kinase YutH [Peribacillus sp. SCS-155]|uniref:spore coat putative kinase YutH n=1 Tax=Peribacillus sedimenti TaxID=3115297 RepID=UPI0039069A45
MLEDVIKQNYGIEVEREERVGRFPSFRSGNLLYSIVPLEKLDQDELMERLKLSEHLIGSGDRYISAFVMSNKQSYISEIDNRMFMLLANNPIGLPKGTRLGRKLAKFHHRARSINYPIKKCSRIGQWKQLWEVRIDQLEKVWMEKLQAHPNNQFERIFVESFPYFMALAENAIQYLVDTEIDENPEECDAGTAGYERFSNTSWSGVYCIKNPFDWVFDHGARDLSEWIREHYLSNQQTYQPGMRQFLYDYQSANRLSNFSFRLLYARLILPIHYFETVENYYQQQSETRLNQLEEKIVEYTEKSSRYEDFLRSFFDAAGIPAKSLQIPLLSWL